MEQLKKCPFCVSEVRFATEDGNWILCPKCGAESAYFNSKEKAIAAWNTRKPLERIVERLGKLKENAWDEEYQTMCDVIEIVEEEM